MSIDEKATFIVTQAMSLANALVAKGIIQAYEAAKPKPDAAMVERVAEAIRKECCAQNMSEPDFISIAIKAIAAINDYMGDKT